MNLQDQNILFFTRTMRLGGTENVILQMCEIFQPIVNKIVVCSCGGVNVERLNAMGIKHIQIDDIESKSLGTFFNVLKILKKIVREENITVIHTHHRMAAFYVSLTGLYKKCVFINTSHNTFSNKKVLTKFSYKHGHLIACGEMVKKNLVDVFRLPDKQITVIHNAVKPFDGNVIEDPLIAEFHNRGYFVVGNIGRLSEQKGMEYFIKAIPDVIKESPNTRFVIAGNGVDEEKLKKLSVDMKVNNYLTFLGYRSDVQNLMSQLDLIVLSSLWEGLPLTPIEAFSVGKTIVATAVDGTVEIVKDKKNGMLVSPKDYIGLAKSIIEMIQIDRKEYERDAFGTFNKDFSFDVFSNKYRNYYEKI